MERQWSMPNSKTFKIKPIKELILRNIEEYLEEKQGEQITIVDPFANEASLREYLPSNVKYITNDLDTQYDTDFHLEATDFLKRLEDKTVDIVLYDPPYSPRQTSEVYRKHGLSVNMETTQASYWAKQKKEIQRITKLEGRVITFGWNSGGIGKVNGFDIIEVLLVAHGGWHNDTICTVDKKIKNND